MKGTSSDFIPLPFPDRLFPACGASRLKSRKTAMHVPVFPRGALCHSNCVTSRDAVPCTLYEAHCRARERRMYVYMCTIRIRIGRCRKQRWFRYDLHCVPYAILERLEFCARVCARMCARALIYKRSLKVLRARKFL